MGLLFKLATDEIQRLSPQIEKAIVTQLPDFLDDPEVVRWVEINGLNRRKNPIRTMSKLAALSLILKLIITESLSKIHEFTPPESSKISDLLSFFKEVNDIVGLEILPTSLLDNLIQLLPLPARPTINKAHEMLEILKENQEHISDLYDAVLSQEERRKMGQFWTPEYIADFMVEWVLRTPDDRLLDLGTGPGIFLLKGMRRLEELGKKKENIHNNLFGVELGFVPYLIGAANLLSRLPSAKGNIAYGDFLRMRPPGGLNKEKTLTDFLSSTETSTFDAIVFNPPYTRHHSLPPFYKKSVLPSFEQRFGVKVSRLSSLFVYFIFHALSFWKKEGRMAFITPTIVFESRKSETLKDFLVKNVNIQAILSFSDEINVFEGVDTAACITLIENSPARDERVTLMEITQWPTKEQIFQVLNNALEGKWEWGKVKRIAIAELDPSKNWTTLVRSDKLTESPKAIPIGKLAHVVRGIATGANDFFTLTDEEVEEERIESSFLKPVLAKTRYAQGFVFDSEDFTKLGEEGKKRWLIYCKGSELDQVKESSLWRYIKKGEEAGLSERSLVQTRTPWYKMEQREIPPILYTYLSRKRARFILNKAGVLALNVFLLVYPSDSITNDETTLKAFLAILNSGIIKKNLRQVGRSYGGDTLKVEPRELDKARVIDPRKLTFEQRTKLAELFDQLCEKSKKPGEERIKQKIDQLILEYIT